MINTVLSWKSPFIFQLFSPCSREYIFQVLKNKGYDCFIGKIRLTVCMLTIFYVFFTSAELLEKIFVQQQGIF